MAQPSQPKDLPAPENAPKEKSPTSPHTGVDGIPDGETEAESTGKPTSEREQTQKARKEI